MNKKTIWSIAFLFMFTILAACSNDDDGASDDNSEEAGDSNTEEQAEGGAEGGGEMPEMPEPDLEGVPDTVAEVNGEEISKDEFETAYTSQFQQMAMQMQMTGEELDQDQLKQQVAESLIGQELLVQEANNEGIEASEDEVNSTIDGLIEQNNFESREDLIAALEEQGTGEEEFMQQVESQVQLDTLINNESGDLEASEEEMQELYDQLVAQQEQQGQQSESGEEQSIPSFEEAQPNLEQQVINQKRAEVVQGLISELRENAEVSTNL
ncbi:SurA N-terminal domain-containing protein [Gracilibacillus timonensis]|uniref:SurA N-terminal domain-containing protein n=1 Tax=Gracilibacillus timonensis TaxID=1816696 RepID=UPI000824928A|nr:SurA N-terminal domain-containing protein [Gracilibacillus timonensis]